MIREVIFKQKRQFNKLNPSHPNPGRREKINLNFYFHTSLWCTKGFINPLKAFIKSFEAPQRSVKIEIYVNFYFNINFLNARDGKG